MGIDITSSLLSCVEEQRLSNSYQQEREQLLKLGIQTSSSLDTAIVFRGLQDILVAVNRKSGDIILCTASFEKLAELVRSNYVIPRDSTYMYEQELMTNGIKFDTINTYIQKGKYHFVKLVPYRKVSSCFLCSFSAFNPYPSFEGYEVYTLSSFSRWFNQLESELEKGYVNVSPISDKPDIVCTRNTSRGTLRKVPCLYAKLYAYDISGAFVQIPVFDIKAIEPYYRSEFERAINEGIVRIGGKNYTSNRSILEKYYGTDYYLLETRQVKERWALEDILEGKLSTLEQVLYKYRFDTNAGFPTFSSFDALVDYLVQSIEERKTADVDKVTVRVLCNVGLISANRVSFYRTVKLCSIPEYAIVPLDEVLPSIVVIAGVSKDYGYQISSTKVDVGCNIKDVCIKDFKRQFGSLYGELEIYKTESDGTPLDLTLSKQRKLAESINAGDFVSNFEEYYKVLVDIMTCNNVPWIDEFSVQHLFINNLVTALTADFKRKGLSGKAYIKDYSVFSVELCKYLRLVKGMNETKHKGYLVNHIRRYRAYNSGLKEAIKGALEGGKDSSGVLCGKLPYRVSLSKKTVIVSVEGIQHSISVGWSQDTQGGIVLSDKYESVR